MANVEKKNEGYDWYCSECNHGPMNYELDTGCCMCFYQREDLRIQSMTGRQPVIDHKAKDCGEISTSQHSPPINWDDVDGHAKELESEAEFGNDHGTHERKSTTHQPDNTFKNFQGIDSGSLAMRTLPVKDLLDNTAISEDQDISDVSDDNTSNSGCSTCTGGSNSTGASSTMDTDISFRAWSLAQSIVDTLAGTTDWRALTVSHPADSNGGSSSKRNNSAVIEGSSDQASRAGKRQCTTGNTKKAKPPNGRDQDEEDEDEEKDCTKSRKKNANEQPRLPCVFFTQSLRRPDLPPMCKNSSLENSHRLK